MKQITYSTNSAYLKKFYYVQEASSWIGIQSKFGDKREWCINNKSKVRLWFHFKRDAYYFYDYGKNAWGFEKESDRNWFLLRWT